MHKSIRFLVPLLAVFALVLASLACGSNTSATPQLVNTQPAAATSASSSNQATSTEAAPADTATPEPPKEFTVGDAVKIGDSVLMVIGWSEVQGDQFSKPDADNKFIAVDLLIVNTSSSSASISSLLQASMKDETGQKYTVDFMASTAAKKGTPDGELASGERIRGTVGFQVPQDAKGLQFVFDASVFGIGKIFVNLGDAPTAVEPPAKLEGETEQAAFKVGEAVQVGTLYITVNEVKPVTGNQFAKPAEGNQFLMVDVTLENKGSAAESISTLLQMWLKDPTGQRYKIDLLAMSASGGTSPDGELAAGEKLKGQVAFEVPANATGLLFVFDGDVFGAGKVSIALP
jgi:hypothetical protein